MKKRLSQGHTKQSVRTELNLNSSFGEQFFAFLLLSPGSKDSGGVRLLGVGGDNADTPVKHKSFKVTALEHTAKNKPQKPPLKCLTENRFASPVPGRHARG